MPNYGSQNFNLALGPGGLKVVVFNAEQPVVLPQTSISVALAGKGDLNTNTNLSLEILFSGVPGNFEIDLMEADTDTPNAYQIAGGGTAKITAVDANNRARLDILNLVSRFVAVRIASRTNNVNLTATLSR